MYWFFLIRRVWLKNWANQKEGFSSAIFLARGFSTKARNICKIFSLVPCHQRKLRQTKYLLFNFWMKKSTVIPKKSFGTWQFGNIGVLVNFIIQKLKGEHLVCLSFLWYQVFLREGENIFYTYSWPKRATKLGISRMHCTAHCLTGGFYSAHYILGSYKKTFLFHHCTDFLLQRKRRYQRSYEVKLYKDISVSPLHWFLVAEK